MPPDLDWTLADAPDADETAHPSEKRSATSPASRAIIGIIGAVVVAALLGLGYYWRSGEARTHRAIEALIALEEQAAHDRDMRAARALVADEAEEWAEVNIIRWVSHDLAAPLPSAFLRPLTDTARLTNLTTLAPDIIRAEVARAYLTQRDETVTFHLAQFYRYANGDWGRIAPPDAQPGELQFYFSPRLEMRYYAVDAARARALAPLIETTLAQACAVWTCPLDYRFSLYFTDPVPSPADYAPAPIPSGQADEPVLFDWISQNARNQSWSTQLYLPASTSIGYPADEFSIDYYSRFIARQVLLQTAGHLSLARGDRLDGSQLRRNAYFYALVARVAAYSGLEAPATLTLNTSPVALPLTLLWDWEARFDEPQPLRPLLRSGLAVVNRLVAETSQPITLTERVLFHNLSLSTNSSAWLVAALNASDEAAYSRLINLIIESFQVNMLTTNRPDLLLGCTGKVLAYTQASSSLTPLIPGSFYNSAVSQWSPDGQRYLMYLYDQPVIIDFVSGKTQILPITNTTTWDKAQWASNSVIAYGAWTTDSDYFLKFYDLANSTLVFQALSGLLNYTLTPNGLAAAVIHFNPAGNGAPLIGLEIMPALGGEPQAIDDQLAIAPRYNGTLAWSPNSQFIAYTRLSTEKAASIRLANIATGEIQTLARGYDLDPQHPPTAAALAWSPDGARLAFAAMQPDRQTSWIGVVNANGTGLRVLSEQAGLFFQINFSADGRYLAAAYYDFTETDKLALFDMTTGERIQLLRDVQTYAWSPTGHTLALATRRDFQLRPEPASDEATIFAEQCNSLAWRPIP